MEITEIIIRLFIALMLGMIIGTERVLAHKTAGMRTYAFVSMGSALFVIITILIGQEYLSLSDNVNFDPSRVISQIVVGVGFLGAGAIMFLPKNHQISGLTTASGIWVSAGIGITAGMGRFDVAIVATILSLFIFIVLWFVEEKIKSMAFFRNELGDDD